jgi:uncharacterized protein (TIGR01777 family)
VKIVTTGGTGLVGTALRASLATRGDIVVNLSRKGPGPAWNVEEGLLDPAVLAGAEAIVHLAGEPLFGRWTPEKRRRIRASRVDGTALLVRAIGELPPGARPALLVSGSAVGDYGARGEEELDESSAPGAGFLAEVAVAWETEALRAEVHGVRVARIRTGIVQSTRGGMLATTLPFFRMGLGGRVGSGDQWVSWIHLDDWVRLVIHVIDRALTGPILATAPHPERQRVAAETVGRILHRPTFAAAPAAALRLALGRGVADELVLASQKTAPRRVIEAGFEFRFPRLQGALEDLLGKE